MKGVSKLVSNGARCFVLITTDFTDRGQGLRHIECCQRSPHSYRGRPQKHVLVLES